MVPQPAQTPGHATQLGLRSSLDDPLRTHGNFRVADLAQLRLGGGPFCARAVLRTTCSQRGVVRNLLRRSTSRRGLCGDRASLAGHTLHHGCVLLAAAGSRISSTALPFVGHLRELPECRYLADEPGLNSVASPMLS